MNNSSSYLPQRRRANRRLLFSTAAWFLASAPAVALPAFPGAEGEGAKATGGRGGRVIKVTTLADSGPGSLRAALKAKDPRTILFDVAGTIELLSPLRLKAGSVTIAGQSAPGGGVTLKNHGMIVDAPNVVIRFIRFRPGDTAGVETDGLTVHSGTDIMIDHVSASWSTDEALSVSQRKGPDVPPLDRVTVQWSFVTEALNRSVHAKGAHGYGSLMRGHDGARFSLHHNLWAHDTTRMPRPGNYESAEADPVGPSFDIRNNVVYDWGPNHVPSYNADTDAVSGYNLVANVYLRGSHSRPGTIFRDSSLGTRMYAAGNSLDGLVPADPYTLIEHKRDAAGYRLASPIAMAPVATDPLDAGYRRVLACGGASYARDAVDSRVVAEVKARSGRIIDHPSDVGGWPELEAGTPRPDGDGDGMPDDWERENGLDPANPADGNKTDAAGYTMLERYLNTLISPCP